MEDHDIFLEEAKKKLKTADFIFSQTLNLVKDKKLLISIIENLYKALENSINALLYYEKYKKTINVIPASFETKIEVFKNLIIKYKIDNNILSDLKHLAQILNNYQKSAIEFEKNQKLVIMTDSKKIESFGIEDTKRFLTHSKKNIEKIENIITGKT